MKMCNIKYFFGFFISDASENNPIPPDVILLGHNSGQVGLPIYKYFSDEEVKCMIDELELQYCVDMDRASE